MEDSDWQAGKTVVEANRYMLRHEISCDVTFSVGESNEEVPAHKYMLVSRSPVLLKLLSRHLGHTDVMVAMPDMKPSIFRNILTYLYTEQCDLHADNVTSMLYAAKRFALQDLSDICLSYLDSMLCVENVCKIMEQAHAYAEHGLHNKCLTFVLEHGSEVLETPGFRDMCSECATDVIRSDDLKAEEHEVYEAVIMWSNHECRRQDMPPTDKHRRQVLGSLLYLIRFPLMDVVYFTQKISFRDVLSNDEAVSVFQYFHGEQGQLSDRFNRKERNRLSSRKPLTKPGQFTYTGKPSKLKYSSGGGVSVANKNVRATTPAIFPTSVGLNMSKVSRFRTYEGQWKQNGPADAICFTCSQPIVLYGIEVFISPNMSETYTVKLIIYDDLQEEIRKSEIKLTTDVNSTTREVMLSRPIRIPARRKFTAVVVIKGLPVVKGIDGQSTRIIDGVIFEFSNSNRSSNGTDVTVGQIPSLLFNITE